MTAVVWFRRDLRLRNNPAFAAASAGHEHVTALFVLDPYLWEHAGPVRGPQLVAHLRSLDDELRSRDGRLRVEHGDPADILPQLQAEAVYWNDDYTPYSRRRDDAVAGALDGAAHRHAGTVVHPPGTVLTKAGDPYRVFTPYWRSWRERPLPDMPADGSASITFNPGIGLPDADPPAMAGGEEAAAARLAAFVVAADEYEDIRDRPDLDATSRLSADLKYGTLSPVEVIEAVGDATPARESFVRQICWRDFWAQMIDHRPDAVANALRPEYDNIVWRDDPDEFAAWCEGRTGYPIVDAAMRQLAAEGWMHNRVRMVTASFLVKHLLVDWRRGERFFRRHLVDGDLAQNVGNWQWVAGTGADAAPYFRIFNPVSQGTKHDPDGAYVRRWVPELREVPNAHIHAPWEGGPLDLAAAGVTLGDTYPEPIVDHMAARERALDAYREALDAADKSS